MPEKGPIYRIKCFTVISTIQHNTHVYGQIDIIQQLIAKQKYDQLYYKFL